MVYNIYRRCALYPPPPPPVVERAPHPIQPFANPRPSHPLPAFLLVLSQAVAGGGGGSGGTSSAYMLQYVRDEEAMLPEPTASLGSLADQVRSVLFRPVPFRA